MWRETEESENSRARDASRYSDKFTENSRAREGSESGLYFSRLMWENVDKCHDL